MYGHMYLYAQNNSKIFQLIENIKSDSTKTDRNYFVLKGNREFGSLKFN